MSMEIDPRHYYSGWPLRAASALLVAFLPLRAQGRAQLRGTIEDQPEAPVANVTVTLISVERVLQTRSGADGSFHFDDIAPDDYEAEFARTGFQKQKLSVNLRKAPVQPLDITLKVGNEPDLELCGSHIAVRYGPLDSSHSRVIGLIGDFDRQKSIAHAHVMLRPSGAHDWRYETQSDKKGEFHFRELPAGRYDVRIAGRDFDPLELKQVMAPRANALFINAAVLKRGVLIVCQ